MFPLIKMWPGILDGLELECRWFRIVRLGKSYPLGVHWNRIISTGTEEIPEFIKTWTLGRYLLMSDALGKPVMRAGYQPIRQGHPNECTTEHGMKKHIPRLHVKWLGSLLVNSWMMWVLAASSGAFYLWTKQCHWGNVPGNPWVPDILLGAYQYSSNPVSLWIIRVDLHG